MLLFQSTSLVSPVDAKSGCQPMKAFADLCSALPCDAAEQHNELCVWRSLPYLRSAFKKIVRQSVTHAPSRGKCICARIMDRNADAEADAARRTVSRLSLCELASLLQDRRPDWTLREVRLVRFR